MWGQSNIIVGSHRNLEGFCTQPAWQELKLLPLLLLLEDWVGGIPLSLVGVKFLTISLEKDFSKRTFLRVVFIGMEIYFWGCKVPCSLNQSWKICR